MKELRVNHSFFKQGLVLFILVATTLFLYLYRRHLFARKQESRQVSINEGYGYYGPVIKGVCKPINKCGKGYRINTQKCILNQTTLKACIDDNGNMTTAEIQEREVCFVECIGSVLQARDGYQKNSPAIYTGTNRIYDSVTGLDYTDEYVESYNSVTEKYTLKKCIPDELKFFYYKTYHCKATDTFGKNICDYVCGADNTLSLDYNLYNNFKFFYPVEDGRYVCNDVHNNNQIELFNSGININLLSAEYKLPSYCYKINEAVSFKLTSKNKVVGRYSYYSVDNELAKLLALGDDGSTHGTPVGINHSKYSAFKSKYALICSIGDEKTVAKACAVKSGTITSYVKKYYIYNITDVTNPFKNTPTLLTSLPQTITLGAYSVDGDNFKMAITGATLQYMTIVGESSVRSVGSHLTVATLNEAIILQNKAISVIDCGSVVTAGNYKQHIVTEGLKVTDSQITDIKSEIVYLRKETVSKRSGLYIYGKPTSQKNDIGNNKIITERSGDKGFYYPLSLDKPTEKHSIITFAEYPGMTFYSLLGKLVYTSNYIDQSYTNLDFIFDNTLDNHLGNAEAKLNYNSVIVTIGTAERRLKLPYSITVLSSGTDYTDQSTVHIKRNNVSVASLEINSEQETNSLVIEHIRSNNDLCNLAENLTQSTRQKQFIDFMKIPTFQFLNTETTDVTISKKFIHRIRDFALLRSPFVKVGNQDNYQPLCYNKNGYPLKKGTKVTVNAGDVIYAAIASPKLNVDGTQVADTAIETVSNVGTASYKNNNTYTLSLNDPLSSDIIRKNNRIQFGTGPSYNITTVDGDDVVIANTYYSPLITAGGEKLKYLNNDISGTFWQDSYGVSLKDTRSIAYASSTDTWGATGTSFGTNTLIYSRDGKFWKSTTGVCFSEHGNGIATNGVSWVAVGNDGVSQRSILYSANGVCYVESEGVSFAEYGNGVAHGVSWVAVGKDGRANRQILVSDDSVTWSMTSGEDFQIEGHDAVYGSLTYVATGNNGTGNTLGNIVYSTDGHTWSQSKGISFLGYGKSVEYGFDLKSGSSLFVAAGHNYGGTCLGKLLFSKDGITWEESTGLSFANPIQGHHVEYGYDLDVGTSLWIASGVCSDGSSALMVSFNGMHWSDYSNWNNARTIGMSVNTFNFNVDLISNVYNGDTFTIYNLNETLKQTEKELTSGRCFNKVENDSFVDGVEYSIDYSMQRLDPYINYKFEENDEFIAIENKYKENYLESGLGYFELTNPTVSSTNFDSHTVKPLELDMTYSPGEIVFDYVKKSNLYMSMISSNKGFAAQNWERVNVFDTNRLYKLNENVIVENSLYKVTTEGYVNQNPKKYKNISNITLSNNLPFDHKRYHGVCSVTGADMYPGFKSGYEAALWNTTSNATMYENSNDTTLQRGNDVDFLLPSINSNPGVSQGHILEWSFHYEQYDDLSLEKLFRNYGHYATLSYADGKLTFRFNKIENVFEVTNNETKNQKIDDTLYPDYVDADNANENYTHSSKLSLYDMLRLRVVKIGSYITQASSLITKDLDSTFENSIGIFNQTLKFDIINDTILSFGQSYNKQDLGFKLTSATKVTSDKLFPINSGKLVKDKSIVFAKDTESTKITISDIHVYKNLFYDYTNVNIYFPTMDISFGCSLGYDTHKIDDNTNSIYTNLSLDLPLDKRNQIETLFGSLTDSMFSTNQYITDESNTKIFNQLTKEESEKIINYTIYDNSSTLYDAITNQETIVKSVTKSLDENLTTTDSVNVPLKIVNNPYDTIIVHTTALYTNEYQVLATPEIMLNDFTTNGTSGVSMTESSGANYYNYDNLKNNAAFDYDIAIDDNSVIDPLIVKNISGKTPYVNGKLLQSMLYNYRINYLQVYENQTYNWSEFNFDGINNPVATGKTGNISFHTHGTSVMIGRRLTKSYYKDNVKIPELEEVTYIDEPIETEGYYIANMNELQFSESKLLIGTQNSYSDNDIIKFDLVELDGSNALVKTHLTGYGVVTNNPNPVGTADVYFKIKVLKYASTITSKLDMVRIIKFLKTGVMVDTSYLQIPTYTNDIVNLCVKISANTLSDGFPANVMSDTKNLYECTKLSVEFNLNLFKITDQSTPAQLQFDQTMPALNVNDTISLYAKQNSHEKEQIAQIYADTFNDKSQATGFGKESITATASSDSEIVNFVPKINKYENVYDMLNNGRVTNNLDSKFTGTLYKHYEKFFSLVDGLDYYYNNDSNYDPLINKSNLELCTIKTSLNGDVLFNDSLPFSRPNLSANGIGANFDTGKTCDTDIFSFGNYISIAGSTSRKFKENSSFSSVDSNGVAYNTSFYSLYNQKVTPVIRNFVTDTIYSLATMSPRMENVRQLFRRHNLTNYYKPTKDVEGFHNNRCNSEDYFLSSDSIGLTQTSPAYPWYRSGIDKLLFLNSIDCVVKFNEWSGESNYNASWIPDYPFLQYSPELKVKPPPNLDALYNVIYNFNGWKVSNLQTNNIYLEEETNYIKGGSSPEISGPYDFTAPTYKMTVHKNTTIPSTSLYYSLFYQSPQDCSGNLTYANNMMAAPGPPYLHLSENIPEPVLPSSTPLTNYLKLLTDYESRYTNLFVNTYKHSGAQNYMSLLQPAKTSPAASNTPSKQIKTFDINLHYRDVSFYNINSSLDQANLFTFNTADNTTYYPMENMGLTMLFNNAFSGIGRYIDYTPTATAVAYVPIGRANPLYMDPSGPEFYNFNSLTAGLEFAGTPITTAQLGNQFATAYSPDLTRAQLYPNYYTIKSTPGKSNVNIVDMTLRENFDYNGFDHLLSYNYVNDVNNGTRLRKSMTLEFESKDESKKQVVPFFDYFSFDTDNSMFYMVNEADSSSTNSLRQQSAHVLNAYELVTYKSGKHTHWYTSSMYSLMDSTTFATGSNSNNYVLNISNFDNSDALSYSVSDTYQNQIISKFANEYSDGRPPGYDKELLTAVRNELDKGNRSIIPESFSLNVLDELSNSRLNSNLLIRDKHTQLDGVYDDLQLLNYVDLNPYHDNFSPLDISNYTPRLMDARKPPSISGETAELYYQDAMSSIGRNSIIMVNHMYILSFGSLVEPTFISADANLTGQVDDTYYTYFRKENKALHYHNTLVNSFSATTNRYTFRLLFRNNMYMNPMFNNKCIDSDLYSKFSNNNQDTNYTFLEIVDKVTNTYYYLNLFLNLPGIINTNASENITDFYGNSVYSTTVKDFILSEEEDFFILVVSNAGVSYVIKLPVTIILFEIDRTGLYNKQLNEFTIPFCQGYMENTVTCCIISKSINYKTCQLSQDSKVLFMMDEDNNLYQLPIKNITDRFKTINSTNSIGFDGNGMLKNLKSTAVTPVTLPGTNIVVDEANTAINYMFGNKYATYWRGGFNYIIRVYSDGDLKLDVWKLENNSLTSKTTYTVKAGVTSFNSFEVCHDIVYISDDTTIYEYDTSTTTLTEHTICTNHDATYAAITYDEIFIQDQNLIGNYKYLAVTYSDNSTLNHVTATSTAVPPHIADLAGKEIELTSGILVDTANKTHSLVGTRAQVDHVGRDQVETNKFRVTVVLAGSGIAEAGTAGAAGTVKNVKIKLVSNQLRNNASRFIDQLRATADDVVTTNPLYDQREKYGTFAINMKEHFSNPHINVKSHIFTDPKVYERIINFKVIKVRDTRDQKAKLYDLPNLVYMNSILNNQNTTFGDDTKNLYPHNLKKSNHTVDKFYLGFEQSLLGQNLIMNNKIRNKYLDVSDTNFLSTTQNLNILSQKTGNLQNYIATFTPWLLECFKYIDDRADFIDNIEAYFAKSILEDGDFSEYDYDTAGNTLNLVELIKNIAYLKMIDKLLEIDTESKTSYTYLEQFGLDHTREEVRVLIDLPFILYLNDVSSETNTNIFKNVVNAISGSNNSVYELDSIKSKYYNVTLDVKIKNLKFSITDQTLKLKYFNTTLLLDLTLYRLFHSLRNTIGEVFTYNDFKLDLKAIQDWKYYSPMSFSTVTLDSIYAENKLNFLGTEYSYFLNTSTTVTTNSFISVKQQR